MCHKLYGSQAGPLGEHIDKIQSAKLLGNSHWLLDFLSPGFFMASLPALNSTNTMGVDNVALSKKIPRNCHKFQVPCLYLLYSCGKKLIINPSRILIAEGRGLRDENS